MTNNYYIWIASCTRAESFMCLLTEICNDATLHCKGLSYVQISLYPPYRIIECQHYMGNKKSNNAKYALHLRCNIKISIQVFTHSSLIPNLYWEVASVQRQQIALTTTSPHVHIYICTHTCTYMNMCTYIQHTYKCIHTMKSWKTCDDKARIFKSGMVHLVHRLGRRKTLQRYILINIKQYLHTWQ